MANYMYLNFENILNIEGFWEGAFHQPSLNSQLDDYLTTLETADRQSPLKIKVQQVARRLRGTRLFDRAPYALYEVNKISQKVPYKDQTIDRIQKIVHRTIVPIEKGNERLVNTELEAVAGINSSYFVKIGSKKVGVFKPTAGQCNLYHRKSPDIEKIARGAYLLDLRNGSHAHIPMTVKAEYCEEKQCFGGHLLAFAENQGAYRSRYQIKDFQLSKEELHAQTLFRLRMFDRDAHDYNMMLNKDSQKGFQIIGIDLDYSLPDLGEFSYMGAPFITLLSDPLASQTMSAQTKRWIASWDVDADAEEFKRLEIPRGSVEMMRFSSWMIQEGAKLNLTPNQICQELFRSTSLKAKVQRLYNQIYGSNAQLDARSEHLFKEGTLALIGETLSKLHKEPELIAV